ncbi:MAG TPA: hypothetical protein VE129_16975, partial [Thermoanaerobaculia bacterium]|nr:hypothetical protein [Thermoanaerobaculia bacterium]
MGHSILEGGRRIVPRFGNSVFLIDTGMLRGYAPDGRPSALEIIGESATAIYEDGRVKLDEPPPSNVRGETPPGSQFAFASLAGDATHPAVGTAWLGPDGSTLPFRTGAEVEAFLRESTLVSVARQKLAGATAPLKV